MSNRLARAISLNYLHENSFGQHYLTEVVEERLEKTKDDV